MEFNAVNGRNLGPADPARCDVGMRMLRQVCMRSRSVHGLAATGSISAYRASDGC